MLLLSCALYYSQEHAPMRHSLCTEELSSHKMSLLRLNVDLTRMASVPLSNQTSSQLFWLSHHTSGQRVL